MKENQGHIDWLIFIPVVTVMLFSIAFVYSASAAYSSLKFGSAEDLFLNHSLRVLLGIAVIILFSRFDYHWIEKWSKPLIILSIILLIAVLFTEPINEVKRWLSFGPLNFQPSEFAKFAVVFHFATLLVRKEEDIKDFNKGFLPFLLWLGVVCFLIAMQPNLSTTLVIYVIGLIIMFIGNTNLLHLFATGLVSVLAGILYFTQVSGYQLNRILAFFGDPTEVSSDHNVNYQLNQALIALGNGGIFGVGPGQSSQSNLYLPESYGDFIYSIIGEEYGFIGAVAIIGLFMLIFWRGMLAAKRAPDKFGYYLAVGILITFSVYVFVNAGVNCGLLPTTGLPMPFISYGGTAVIFYSAATGILLNISAKAGTFSYDEES